MSQQERKGTNRNQRDEENRNQLQRSTGRAESLWRDPISAFWVGRDPFASFWEPFALTMRHGWPAQSGRRDAASHWSPQLETFQRGNEFVVRADLPGLNKDDVKIDITDSAMTIEGERREEHEEEREGFYRSERSYGSFYRMIPLPEGAISDSAKASFNNGVLEIVVQAPPREVSRGRRLEITQAQNQTQNQNLTDKERSESAR